MVKIWFFVPKISNLSCLIGDSFVRYPNGPGVRPLGGRSHCRRLHLLLHHLQARREDPRQERHKQAWELRSNRASLQLRDGHFGMKVPTLLSFNFVLRTFRWLDDLWIKKKLWHFMLSIRLWDLDLRPPHNSDKPGFSRYPNLLSSLHPEVYHSLSYKRVSVSVFLIYECYFNLKYLLNVELHPTVPYCSCT